MRLEPRDVIYNLDSLPIRAAVDVMKDYRQTSVSFIDGRTGRAFAGKMVLPPPIRVLIALRRAGGAWASVCGGLVSPGFPDASRVLRHALRKGLC